TRGGSPRSLRPTTLRGTPSATPPAPPCRGSPRRSALPGPRSRRHPQTVIIAREGLPAQRLALARTGTQSRIMHVRRSSSRRGGRSNCCRSEQTVQVVVDDLDGVLIAALAAEDAGGQAVREGQKTGDFGTRVTIGGDLPGLLCGGQPGSEDVLQRVGQSEP